jgi:hypothetical protein
VLGARIANRAATQFVFAVSALLLATSAVLILSLSRQLSRGHHQRLDYRPPVENCVFRTHVPFGFALVMRMMTGLLLPPNYCQDVIGLDLVQIGRLGPGKQCGVRCPAFSWGGQEVETGWCLC